MILLLRIADRLRRVVWRVFGPRTVGVRGLVVDEHGAVLLVRHSYGPPAWHLPGGGVKRRERLYDALCRELLQETGVRVAGPVRLLGTYSNLREGKSDHISVFVVTAWERRDSADAEIAEAAFFPADDLPAAAAPGTRRRIAEWLAGDAATFDW